MTKPMRNRLISHRLCLWPFLFTIFARVFGDGALVYHRFIEPPAACKVIAVVAVACENTAGKVGTKSRMAMNVDGSVFRDFIYSLPQGVKRNIDKTVDLALHHLKRCTGIEQEHTTVTGRFSTSCQKNCLSFPLTIFSATKPSILTGSFALLKGGA